MERILNALLSPFAQASERADLVLDAMTLMPWWYPHVLMVCFLGLVTCFVVARRVGAR